MYFKYQPSSVNLTFQAAYTLLEMVIVVLITGILAYVMIPDISSTDPVRLDLTAEEFTAAMRFARSESMRLKKPYGFRLRSINKRIQVASMDESTSPWTLVYDVYHPISKKLYDIDLGLQTTTGSIDISRVISFRGTCNNVRKIYFDSNGSAWCANPENIALERLDLTFSLGTHTRIVTLDGITGRVTLQ